MQIEKISGTPKDIEEAFGIPRATLSILRHQGRGPKYSKPAGRILYRFADVEEWIKHSEIKTSDSIEIENVSKN